ncbi:MAG: EI24 domain-containing protein [Bdellovibrionota bacterium]
MVFVAGLSWGFPFVTGLVHPTSTWIIGVLPLQAGSGTYGVFSWLIPVLLWPPFILFLLYLLWILTRLLAAPFYLLLAERVLIESGAINDQKFHLVSWVRINVRMAIVSIIRTFSFALIGLVLFLLSFIPGAGIFTSICFLLIVTSDVCDYAFEAMQWSFPQRMAFLRQHFGFIAGFSVVFAFVFLIPGLNFFLLPASVVGATDVVRRLMSVKDASREDYL